MKKEKNKLGAVLMAATILLISAFADGDLVISPIIYQFYEMFPDSVPVVNFIVSGGYLVIMLVSIFTSKLNEKISSKVLLFAGGLICTVSGVMMYTIPSAIFIAIMRAIFAVGVGLTSVCGVSVIYEVYTDENTINKMVGYRNAALSLIGAVIAVVAGQMAEVSIENTFRAYWIFAPITLMILLFIPNTKALGSVSSESSESKNENKHKLGRDFWRTLTCFCLFSLSFFMMTYYISLYVTENELGSESMVGFLNSASYLACAVTAAIFGALYGKMHHKLIVISYFIAALDFIGLWLFPSVITAYAGLILNGFVYGIAFTFVYAYCAEVVHESRVNDSISYITACYSLAAVVTTYFVTFCMSLFRTDRITPLFSVAFVLCLIVTLWELASGLKHKSV